MEIIEFLVNTCDEPSLYVEKAFQIMLTMLFCRVWSSCGTVWPEGGLKTRTAV